MSPSPSTSATFSLDSLIPPFRALSITGASSSTSRPLASDCPTTRLNGMPGRPLATTVLSLSAGCLPATSKSLPSATDSSAPTAPEKTIFITLRNSPSQEETFPSPSEDVQYKRLEQRELVDLVMN